MTTMLYFMVVSLTFKCIISHPHNTRADRYKDDVSFSISGSMIENVNSWSHLGHNISNNCSDTIANCRSSFIGQASA